MTMSFLQPDLQHVLDARLEGPLEGEDCGVGRWSPRGPERRGSGARTARSATACSSALTVLGRCGGLLVALVAFVAGVRSVRPEGPA